MSEELTKRERKNLSNKKYREKHLETIREKSRMFYYKHQDAERLRSRVKSREYRIRYHNQAIQSMRRSRIKTKVEALFIVGVGNVECIRCGCNDVRFLEINHKHGDGGEERKLRAGQNLYQQIKNGRRKTSDLEILCRPCNHIHYLEMKYGETGLKVTYENYKIPKGMFER